MRELAPLSVRNQPVRVNRVGSVVALLVIVGLVGNSQAADYKSGWYVGESGSELNLNSAESFGEQIWVFGDSGLILISSDLDRLGHQQHLQFPKIFITPTQPSGPLR